MIKLWIDDLRDPEAFGHEGWHWAKSVTEAIRILDEQNVVEVSLDHDICHPTTVSGSSTVCSATTCLETYEPVARFIAQMHRAFLNGGGHFGIEKITLHTANSVGAKKMRDVLDGVACKIITAMAEASE
jgi:hypothetical protein